MLNVDYTYCEMMAGTAELSASLDAPARMSFPWPAIFKEGRVIDESVAAGVAH